MGKSKRDKQIEATREYYNIMIKAFEDVILDYEANEQYEDCQVLLDVINDLKSELRLIEIVEYTGRNLSY